ncbi:NAD-dependent epimerase/dehydratase family protein [Phenylobacterium soli]|uniref:NAD-dependent epimerase/dehydratase domain-containing protein n=1 Tax=Phenylobacterium soli TaxID=2170551 RepID=A0A328AG12_9CAUL|nr:NAD-dependent epimerase/dehydratase family protein [Phenylobacterium soli]RAK53670.1 hypothetical protein DJ017_03570 [Phenylobacterium soli]
MTAHTLGQKPLALVIGATGAFGGETARQLVAGGWRVRALHRRPDQARVQTGLAADWVKGDAMSASDVRRAAEGARVIVHAANPPGYKNWRGLAAPMLDNSIAAAKAENARILLPGNVYNYGPDVFGRPIDEAAAQTPRTRKGKIRVEMERRLRDAAQSGAKSLVLRAGDFFGPAYRTGWMGQIIFQAGKPIRSLTYPGDLSVRHAWAYLPDLAATAVRLLEKEDELSAVAGFQFAGHALTGHELRAAFERAVGRKLPVMPFPWFALAAVGPFNETFRELYEMRYLWRETVTMDEARLKAVLGTVPHTPIDEAVTTTLTELGCVAPTATARAA